MEKFLFTSESVTEGHPDKVCDAISDSVLDALMAQDPMSRVACETCTTTDLVMVMGEITTKADVDVEKIVREAVTEIGYTKDEYGFNADTCPSCLENTMDREAWWAVVHGIAKCQTGLSDEHFPFLFTFI